MIGDGAVDLPCEFRIFQRALLYRLTHLRVEEIKLPGRAPTGQMRTKAAPQGRQSEVVDLLHAVAGEQQPGDTRH